MVAKNHYSNGLLTNEVLHMFTILNKRTIDACKNESALQNLIVNKVIGLNWSSVENALRRFTISAGHDCGQIIDIFINGFTFRIRYGAFHIHEVYAIDAKITEKDKSTFIKCFKNEHEINEKMDLLDDEIRTGKRNNTPVKRLEKSRESLAKKAALTIEPVIQLLRAGSIDQFAILYCAAELGAIHGYTADYFQELVYEYGVVA